MSFANAQRVVRFASTSTKPHFTTKPSFTFHNLTTRLQFQSFAQSTRAGVSIHTSPRHAQLLERHLVDGKIAPALEDTQVTFVNGFWRQPKINNRKLKLIKKLAEEREMVFVDPRPVVEKKDNPENFQRPKKGHRWEEKKEKRLETIKKKMKEMPKLIDEYRAQYRKAREVDYKPILLFYPKPILDLPRRETPLFMSQERIRAERKKRRKEAKEKRRRDLERAASGSSEEKKKAKNEGTDAEDEELNYPKFYQP